MLNNFVAALLALVGFVVILVVLLTLPVYFLWNWVGVDVLHLPIITLWQALGINLLAGCLFGKLYTKK